MTVHRPETFVDQEISPDDLPADRHPDGWVFERCRFRHLDLGGLSTTGCRFVACDLTGVDLSGSHHTGSAFTNCGFQGARSSGTSTTKVSI